MAKILIGLVSEGTSGKHWARGAIWKKGKDEYQFLCRDCSIRELKNLRLEDATPEECERVREGLAKVSDVAGPLEEIPKKFTDSLYVAREEGDWTYSLRPNEIIKCESCAKLVI